MNFPRNRNFSTTNEYVPFTRSPLYPRPKGPGFTGLRNGKILTYERAFSLKFCEQFEMSDIMVENIIKGKVVSWKNLLG